MASGKILSVAGHTRSSGLATLICGTALLVGCDRPVEPGIALEPVRVEGLHETAETVGDGIANARQSLRSDPDRAERDLDRASRALSRLELFYVPLLEARQAAVNAMRHRAGGHDEEALAALESVEENLQSLLRSGLTNPREVEATQSLLTRARTEIAAGDETVPPALRELALRLHDMLVKSGLVLEPQR